DNGRNRYWGPSVGVGLPIFDQGIVGKEQALAVQRLADKTFVALAWQVRQDVREALADYANAADAAANARKVLIPQQEEATRPAEESWRAGVVDFEPWLSSLRDLAAARSAALSADQDAQHALVALEQAVGLSLGEAQKKAAKAAVRPSADPSAV